GRLSHAPTAPNVSANAMIAPPCRMLAAVQRSARTASVPRTRSFAASTSSIPISRGKGWRLRISVFMALIGTLFIVRLRADISANDAEFGPRRTAALSTARGDRAQRADRAARLLEET